jgi:hypothetical protein
VTNDPLAGDQWFHRLAVHRRRGGPLGVPRDLVDAAAPEGRADEYRALANSTAKCVDEPFMQPACAVTSALGGKLPVANEHIARAIFLAMEGSLKPDANRARFPEVKVVDYGDHWAVFRGRSPKRFLLWREAVTFGGGQLEMFIDKCDGSLSDVHLSE